MKTTARKMNPFKASLLVSAVVPMSLLAGTAYAQGASSTAALTDDQIIVTGSRIRRSNLNTAIPVQSLDIGDIQSSGTVDLAEILVEIPGVDFSLSPESTGLSVQNAGLSTISLRGLGGDRTLTLINGRRAVSNSGNGERVSLQTIPSGFVRKVEITTGGASAIYGADAIAGVVNILLHDNFDGIKASYRYSTADRSGERENTVDFTVGKNFDNDRGNVLFGFSYDDETPVFADSTRPESLPAVRFIGGTEQFGPSLSSFLPGGRFEGDDAWNINGVWFNDQSLVPPDGRVPSIGFETSIDGFNFRPGRTLSPGVETYSGGFKADYDLSSSVTAFGDIYFTRTDTLLVNAARVASSGTDIGPLGNSIDIGTIASNHPFIPPEVEETRRGTVSWARRFTEVGNTTNEIERETLRSSAGFRGEIDNGWAWDVSGTFGRFTQEQTQLNAINFQNIRNALRIESDGAGGFQCTDAAARAEGCVPLNIFGTGSISTEAADYIRENGVLLQTREQFTFSANANGEVYQLPAGSVKAAFGVEYRNEAQETIGYADNILEETSLAFIPDLNASFDVIEGYGELDIPLISGRAGIESLSLQLAGRIGNYSTIGTIFSYNAGGSWAPSPDIRFRGQFSRSQRAPNITEFFSAPRGDFDSLDDPCNGLNADGTGIDPTNPNAAAFTANCLADPGITAFFADPANAGQSFDGDDNVFGPNSGNDQLQEETANTFTIGAVITPRNLPNFSFVVDYYRIDIDGAIGTISTQDVVDLCFQSIDFPNNRFCDVVTRDGSTGDVLQVINRDENLNNRLVEGIDFTLNYGFDLPALPGEFDLRVIYSHALTNNQVFEGLNGPELTEFNGQIATAKDRFRARIGWDHNNFRMTYTWHYFGSVVDDATVAASDPDFFNFGSQSYHDVYASYKFENHYGAQVFGGIRNLTNDLGPFVPTGFNSGGSRNITENVNRPVGREFYAGVRVTF